MKDKIKICLVNRNYPPTKGATGYFANQLISYVDKRLDFDVTVISVADIKSPADDHITIKGLYGGKQKFLRLFSSFSESYRLLKKARGTGADVYIIMTDPPFLTYWAARILKNEKWINWTMDVYPDAFVSNGLITASNWIYRIIVKTIKNNPPNFLISLGHNQSLYLQKKYYPDTAAIPVPVGLRTEDITAKIGNSFQERSIVFGYVGNLGEAHDSELLYQLIQYITKSGFDFILSCAGSKSEELISRISNLKNVRLHQRISNQEMEHIDIHVISLMENWTHICVPSKAITALQFGAAILFLGSKQSDTWQYVKDAGWCLNHKKEFAQFVKQISIETIEKKKLNSIRTYKHLKGEQASAFKKIEEELVRLAEE